jgi:hypothetical protein
MRWSQLVAVISYLAMPVNALEPQLPALPNGAKTHWVVEAPEEIVTYVAFDTSVVRHRLPPRLRFITLKELALGGLSWAEAFLGKHPTKGNWGVSFLEIVRMKVFSIDGRSPEWPKYGAVALWFARVAQSNPTDDLGPGRPFLALGFWVPDKNFVPYMNAKGYSADYGKVRLHRNLKGAWVGSIEIDGLRVAAECRPNGAVTGGDQSAGIQAFFAPLSTSQTDVVRVAFAGHREQLCIDDSNWNFQGKHPLVRGITLGPSSFQFGYQLVGGTYTP